MSVRLQWLAKDRVVYSHFSGVVTLPELRQVTADSIELINAIDPEIPMIHAIVDNRHVKQFPKNTYQINRILNGLLTHARLGWILYVSDMNPLLQVISSLVVQIAHTRYRTFSNVPDAIEFLQFIDSPIPNLSTVDWSDLPNLSTVDWSDLPIILEINALDEPNSTS